METAAAFFSVLLLTRVHCQGYGETAVVRTTSGPVQGYVAQTLFKNLSYSIFKGIPFAEPPLGNLRFRAPVPIAPWTEVLDATQEGPICPQIDKLFWKKPQPMGDEDCLRLNVYTPALNFRSTEKYPTMVYIYGGSFVEGYKDQVLYGPDFFVEEGAILVTFNYRIGVLGFLSLGIPGALGNAGLKDQVLALKWVQQNIERFGGDPGNVTLFGESSGSTSVILHELSSRSEGLYQRSISQSGAALIFLYHSPQKALVSAHVLASILNFDTPDKEKLLQFYLRASAYDLVAATSNMYLLSDHLTRPFLPTVEDASVAGNDVVFLDECPISLMAMGRIREGPKILGYIENELLAFSDDIINLLKAVQPDVTPLVSIARPLTQFLSNVSYSAEIDLTQRFFAAHNGRHPVYYYLMTYIEYPRHLVTLYAGNVATHGDDVGLLFASKKFGITDSTDPNDRLNLFRRRFVRLWINFAKYGNPTPAFDNPIDVVWEPSGPLGRQLDIGSPFKMRDRALRDPLCEIFYYHLLPMISGCRTVWYGTPYDQLFRN